MHAAFFLLEIATRFRTWKELICVWSCDWKADDDLSVLTGITALLISLLI